MGLDNSKDIEQAKIDERKKKEQEYFGTDVDNEKDKVVAETNGNGTEEMVDKDRQEGSMDTGKDTEKDPVYDMHKSDYIEMDKIPDNAQTNPLIPTPIVKHEEEDNLMADINEDLNDELG